jgi:hypothetical protein
MTTSPPSSASSASPSSNSAAPEHMADDGTTQANQDGDKLPRLPHERDETAGKEGTQKKSAKDAGAQQDVGKKAFDDATGDTTDTSYAPVTDKVYNEKVGR